MFAFRVLVLSGKLIKACAALNWKYQSGSMTIYIAAKELET